VPATLLIQDRRRVLLQENGKSVDVPKRRVQIVRYRIVEGFQFLIGGLQLSGM